MGERPYVVLSCAVSVDGYLDDTGPERLMLSSEADLERVDEVRASVDAILVGANTVRADDPRLVLRSAARQAAREARGRTPDPVKVTVTRTGELDPGSRFFTVGYADKLVYAASGAVHKLRANLNGIATVIDAGEPPRLRPLLADLADRGVARLMVEGGAGVLGWFLTERVADELQLVIAPIFVGDPAAPHWLRDGVPPQRVELAETRQLGDCVLLRYLLEPRDG
ncbi:MAG: RibD family protein [Micromonosporaceae bacterium]